jgi:WD40 repeat protein
LKTQLQYDFHTSRITCAATHPSKSFVCTAEISNSFPIVHVWDMNSMTLIHDFKTRHNRFISKLEFSREGDMIVSLGGPPLQQSIEVYDWVRE